ncbi:hypothetical protein NEOLI_002266 [Neolecta irregularis DAH-3]|uniref:Endoplasmic reticulum transmembrane protein n=1 Tax=Neolecta irregularis (strain DAH-3) TaxID=1198029 RepID=A0A1U7LK25_NEOID|nr:hypothetical protein NEOLI_002266 [Neolecta irregularis DAH-3]|eukprot:OLL23016.1 hypothetical protein NEOLI_002266 [Neolecta irregularis DAH-3]
MTLYYSLVFVLLIFEMGVFCALILPIPFTWRRKLFKFISTSPLIAKLKHGMKIMFISVLVLFIDSVNRVFKVTEEASLNVETGVRDSYRTDMQARKFYSQRNMYLCGFTLFLSLILNRLYLLLNDAIRYEEQLAELRARSSDATKYASISKEVEALRKELHAKDKDFERLKLQADQNNKNYDELVDRYVKETGKSIADIKKVL